MRVPGSTVRRLAVAAVAALAAPVLGAGAVPSSAAPVVGELPFVTNLVESGGQVRVGFKDRTFAEDAFQLFRRGLTGSWEYVVEAPTQDRTGARLQAELADPRPNALRCYMVVAYDNAGFFVKQSPAECVGGGWDPFDASRTGIAAPRVSSVQGQWGPVVQIRVNYVDRSRTESRFKLFRRQGGTLIPLGESTSTTRTGVGQPGALFDSLPFEQSGSACYTVQAIDDVTTSGNYSNEVCLTAPTPLPAPPRADRVTSTAVHTGPPNGGGFTGDSAVAVGGDGLPIVAFRGHDHQSGKLMVLVAHCDDAACTSSTVTPVGADGRYLSIAIGSDGLAVVGYVSWTQGVLAAHCSNRACTSRTLATVEPLDSLRVGALELSIGSDGLPTIVYEDNTRVTAGVTLTKLARCRDVACTAFTVTDIGPALTTADRQPLAIATGSGTGLTHVAFLGDNGEPAPRPRSTVVKVTTCLNPACTSRSTNPIAWQASDLLRPGAGMSMTVGRDGLPLLTYAWDTGLVVARCVNIFCTGVTTRFHDDPSWGVHGVWETAIAVGADGLGLISYYDAWALRVMTVHCADVACGSAFLDMVQTIPAANPSVAVGADGLPVIAFGTNKQYLVRCRDAVCTRF